MISIIIPALNAERYIGTCLSAILKMTTGREQYEVILVDNGSSDGTLRIAQTYQSKLNLKVLTIPGVTISTLRNTGVAHSKGELLAFLDADCAVSESWIETAQRHFDDPAIAATGFGYEIPENSTWVARAWDLNPRRGLGLTDYLPSGNLFVRRANYLDIGGFNPQLITNEDFDLCFRLRKNGFAIYSDPAIQVTHLGEPQTLKSFFKKQQWHGTHVVKVFFENIRELKNLKAVSYALYFLFFSAFFAIGAPLFLIIDHPAYIVIPITALLAPPSFISLKILSKEKLSLENFSQLGCLYLVYGFARASSILRLK
jgi:glycosyltransferase involved in cell wall biosynthesis